VIENGVLLSNPFLTVPVDANGERGPLGLAFDPNFTSRHQPQWRRSPFSVQTASSTLPSAKTRTARTPRLSRTSTRMFINDVGQNTWEEIDDGIAGSNYGWPETEGSTSDPRFRSSLYSYGHGTGPFLGCAITGGVYPNVGPFPTAYFGKYFFAEFCGGWINRFDPATGAVQTFASGISSPVDLQVGPDGNLFYLARGSSAVFRVSFTGSQAPQITQHPASQTISVGQPVTFSVCASGTPPLAYQ
jgi:hypothetical protein